MVNKRTLSAITSHAQYLHIKMLSPGGIQCYAIDPYNINQIQIFISLTSASQKMKCSIAALSKALNHSQISNGYYWCDINHYKSASYQSKLETWIQYNIDLCICQLDNTSKVIHVFRNAQEITDFLGQGFNNNIIDCCLGKQHTAYGYRWCYYKDLSHYNITFNLSAKWTYQYDKQTGQFINAYESAGSAARALNKPTTAGKVINAACTGNKKSAYGYYWSYKKIDNYFNLSNHNIYQLKTTKVYQYDPSNYSFIAEYDSALLASQFLGHNDRQGIQRACTGKTKTAYGYYWSYIKADNYKDIKND